jgi:hypothetical protein
MSSLSHGQSLKTSLPVPQSPPLADPIGRKQGWRESLTVPLTSLHMGHITKKARSYMSLAMRDRVKEIVHTSGIFLL